MNKLGHELCFAYVCIHTCHEEKKAFVKEDSENETKVDNKHVLPVRAYISRQIDKHKKNYVNALAGICC
jgi:hypothetical protein